MYQPGDGLEGFTDADKQAALAMLPGGANALTTSAPPPPEAPPPIPPGAGIDDLATPTFTPGTTAPVASTLPNDNLASPTFAGPPPALPGSTPATAPTVAAATPPAPVPTAAPQDAENVETKATTDLGAPPERPIPTGNAAQDELNNRKWQGDLSDYGIKLQGKKLEIENKNAEIEKRRADAALAAQKQSDADRQKEQLRYQQLEQQRQAAVDKAVAEKQAALDDAKDGKQSWADTIFGAVAIALGSYGQGLQLAGHVAGAKNEGLEAVNRRIARDDQKKRERITNASDSLLEARYGFKDAADNHRAALQDLDAETAAKFKTIEAEAVAQLKAGGATQAEIDSNAIVLDARQKYAQTESGMIERQRGHEETERHDKSLEADRTEARADRQEDRAFRREQLAIAYADRRDRADDRKTAQEDKKVAGEVKATSSEFDKDEGRLMGTSRTPGVIPKQKEIRELGDGLRQAIASGDPQEQAAAALRVQEKIARLNTGAAPSHEQMKLFDSLQGTPEQKKAQLAQLFGDPKVSEQLLGGLMKVVDQSDEGALKQIDTDRQNLVTKYLGSNGGAATPEQRRHALGRIAGIFDGVTTRTKDGEVARYQNDPNAAPAAKPKSEKDQLLDMADKVDKRNGVAQTPAAAVPAGLPAGAVNTGRTSGGKPVYKLANGQLVTGG